MWLILFIGYGFQNYGLEATSLLIQLSLQALVSHGLNHFIYI